VYRLAPVSLITDPMDQSPSEGQSCSAGRNVWDFMESEGSFQNLQQPNIESYTEPDDSIPHPHTLLL
jgi:hypothetical protein